MSGIGSKSRFTSVESKRVFIGNTKVPASTVGNIQAQNMTKYKLPGSKSFQTVQYSSQARDCKFDAKQSKFSSTYLNRIIYCVVCGSSNDAITQQMDDSSNKPTNTEVCNVCSSYMYEDQILNKDPNFISSSSSSSSLSSMPSYKLLFDWKDIEQKMMIRGEINCPICMMPFRLMKETLLSCSHIFHTPCLRSFEKFTFKNNNNRFCPLCRESNYYAKNTNLGSQIYHNTCMIKLQCLYRGYAARKKYYFILKHLYQSGHGKQTKNRRKFYERELIHQTDWMTQQIDVARNEVDDLISSTDHTMNESKSLDDAFTQMLLNRAANNNTYTNISNGNESNSNPHMMIHNNNSNNNDDDDDDKVLIDDSHHYGDARKDNILSLHQWKEILKIAMERGICECAICMTTISTTCMTSAMSIIPTATTAASTSSSSMVGKTSSVLIKPINKETAITTNTTYSSNVTNKSNKASIVTSQNKNSNNRHHFVSPPQNVNNNNNNEPAIILPHPISIQTSYQLPITSSSSSSVPMRNIVLLSCTHIFHQQCIQNLESFAHYTALMMNGNDDEADSKKDDSSHASICPICRSSYSKRILRYQHEIDSYVL